MLREVADIHLQPKGIAEEPAEAMDDDDIEWAILIGCPFDHPLEFVPAVVHRRRTRLHILCHN